jgi:cytochrome c oxidase cbb3-type subunit 4
MWKALFQEATLLQLPLFGLLFFVAVFGIVLARVWRRGRHGGYDQAARMPLCDDGGA